MLVTKDDLAVFGWWRPHPASGIKAMNGLDGWTCTIFRNISPMLSSALILEAERILVAERKSCGPDGLLTYVWNAKVTSSNPGACFQHAGWSRTTWSADGRKRLWRKRWDSAGRE